MKRLQTSRGMATVMAVVLIGLLAVVLTAVAAAAVAEQRNAVAAAADAQASQLLAAAAVVAQQQAADGTRVDGPIDTPAGRVTLAWNGTAACGVEVAVPGAGRHATLRFEGTRVVGIE